VRISRAAGRNQSLEEPGRLQLRTADPKGSLLEGFLFHVGAEPTGRGQQHDGEELFFVISGTVSMRTPDRNYILEAGDCAYFPGHLSYHMHRIGSEPAIALIAVGRERSLVKRQPASESLTVEGAV
jgi:mannose-6-phosphate isomerase-like protein (cupin superfamily)